MEIEATAWYALDEYAPAREGWYEVQLESGETAFARYIEGAWTDKPELAFTHWRGLRSDPTQNEQTPDSEDTVQEAESAQKDEGDSIDAEAAAADGVQAVWNAFFPGGNGEAQKPLEPAQSKPPTTH